MRRRDFLSLLAATQIRPALPRRPNLLFILADQWRAQALPAAGDPDLDAPNLARLGQQGVHFRRAYASNPVCSPSRASVLTGRFPHSCQVRANNKPLPLEEECMAVSLKKAGYATGYIGKWHLDGKERPGFVPPGPRRHGFDYWAAFNRGHLYFRSVYYRDTPEPVRESRFEPDYQTELAIEFIRANRTRPFYLYLSWGPPHTPRTPPPRYANKYDPRQFRLRENVPGSRADEARQGLAGYYGLCSALDENLGKLLKTLEEERLAEDTLVLFTADHGDMVGSHGLEYKGWPHEESARIPLLMRYPRKLPAGAASGLLISNVDYMPTLLSLCGAEVPQAAQGRDLAQALVANGRQGPESVFTYGRLDTPGEWRMVVRGMDKLVVDAEMNVTHLYNLALDPFEMINLSRDPAHKRSRDELKAHLGDWMRRIEFGQDRSGLRLRR